MTKSQHPSHPHTDTHKPQEVAQAPRAVTPQASRGGEGLAITSMILGTVSIVGFMGMILGIPAIILGVIALKKKTTERGLSITGIVTGAISTFFSLLFILFMVFLVIYALQHPSEFDDTTPPSQSDTYHHPSLRFDGEI